MKKFKNIFKRSIVFIISTLLLFISSLGNSDFGAIKVFAQQSGSVSGVSYPLQEVHIGIANTNRNVSIAGTSSGSLLCSEVSSGTDNDKWSVTYVSSGVYEIKNSATGMIMTNNGYNIVLATDSDSSSQRFNIVGTDTDFEGNYLYYKIVSCDDSSMAVTFEPTKNNFALATYSGSTYQKFKLNLNGLEGYAANCVVSGGEKAGTIGGLLGQTVVASDLSTFISYLDSTDPLTIVVNGDFEMYSYDKTKQRIRDNKTIIGSYGNKTLYDSQLRNDDFYGSTSDAPSNNIVISNMNFVAKTLNSNGCGVICLYIYGGRNIWVDHCSFSAIFTQDKDNEVGKFMWINTPALNWADATYNAINPDYITISYCSFKNRFWTVAFGSQNTDTSRVRTTMMFNRWEQCSRRTPQIGNGTLHNYCSLYTVTGSSNANASAEIIAGEGSVVFSEANRFEAYTGKEFVYDTTALSAYDYGSYTSSTVGGTPSALGTVSYGTKWHSASDVYGYEVVSAYQSSGYDVRTYVNCNAGSVTSASNMNYITDSSQKGWIAYSYSAPFLTEISVGTTTANTTASTSTSTDAVYSTTSTAAHAFDTNCKYQIKNVNSNMYLDVAGGAAANGTNVQQWSSDGAYNWNTWKLDYAGNGYYYIRSYVDSSKTYYLDVDYGKTDNGTNIQIYQNTNCSAQMFKFVPNDDGTYQITTAVSGDSSCLGIAYGSNQCGGNVVEWTRTGETNQSWYIEPVYEDGCAILDEGNYMIQNVYSGLYLDVTDGVAADGVNVQTWGAAGAGSYNTWRLSYAGDGWYYIYSAVGDGSTYLLDTTGKKATDGTNMEIYHYTGASSQLFRLIDNGDGSYTIATRCSNAASCLDITGHGTTNGTNVSEWTISGASNQHWYFKAVD
jgi:pectin lyase